MSDNLLLQRGIQLFNLNKYDEAIKALQQALQQDPNDVTIKFYIGCCYVAKVDLKKAEPIVESILGEANDFPEIFYLMAAIKLNQDKNKEALAFNNEAISINPSIADFYGQKAEILLHMKKFTEGLEAADMGLELDARNLNCLNLRGLLLTKLNRKEEAEQTVENVLNEGPEDHMAFASSGWVALENGTIKKALDYFKEALKLNPNSNYAKDGMSKALKSKNLVYRWYLKYAFWIGNMSSKNQYIFIIGIYLAYRFGVKALNQFDLAYLALPLIVIYLFFALGAWIMEPLANSILNFDRYGKYLLNQREKQSGYIFLSLFLLFLIAAAGYFITKNDYFLLMGAVSICPILPATNGLLRYDRNSRIIALSYAGLMILVGLGSLIITQNPVNSAIAVLIMMVIYTWIGNFLKS